MAKEHGLNEGRPQQATSIITPINVEKFLRDMRFPQSIVINQEQLVIKNETAVVNSGKIR